MGTLSFVLPSYAVEAQKLRLERTGISSGYELSPQPVQRTLQADQLKLHKETSDSGYLTSLWPLDGIGDQLLMSATLRDRPEPYVFLNELTRGRLNHLRRQLNEWESVGFQMTAAQQAELSRLTKLFGQLVLDPDSPEASTTAEGVLAGIFQLSESVALSFASQLMMTRHQEHGRLEVTLGCRMTKLPPPEEQTKYLASFTAVRLVPLWAEIEPSESNYQWDAFDQLLDWALSSGLAVSVGPLIDLANGPFPNWFEQWSGDLPSLAAFACDYIETIIRRYKDRLDTWQVFSGFNHTDTLALVEDDRLRLAARVLDAARQTNPTGNWIIGVAQPWGDYLSSEAYTYSPIVFADTLQRAGFKLAALELEVLSGPDRRASDPRDILEFYRLLDLYNYMGLPLEVTLGDATPGSATRLETRAQLALALPNIRSVFWEAWHQRDAVRIPGTEFFPHLNPSWLPEFLNMTGLAATRPLGK